MLFVGSCAGKFYALDRHTGRTRWEYNIRQDGDQTSFHSSPLVAGDLILVATDNTFRHQGIGHVYAFEQATGQLHWKHRSEAGIPTDVVRAGSSVFVVTLADELLCLDLDTGHLRWKYASGAENPDLQQTASAAVWEGKVIFGTLNGDVCAFEASSGRPEWKSRLGSRISATPLLCNGSLYVGTSQGRLYRLDPGSGEVTASMKVPEAPRGMPLCTGQSLVVLLGNEVLACVDLALESIRWTRPAQGQWGGNRPLLWNELVLAVTSQGQVAALSVDTGRLRWSRSLEGKLRSISSHGATLYVGTLEGTLYTWRPPNPGD
jgi:outer membrane protein assembly factor BamB